MLENSYVQNHLPYGTYFFRFCGRMESKGSGGAGTGRTGRGAGDGGRRRGRGRSGSGTGRGRAGAIRNEERGVGEFGGQKVVGKSRLPAVTNKPQRPEWVRVGVPTMVSTLPTGAWLCLVFLFKRRGENLADFWRSNLESNLGVRIFAQLIEKKPEKTGCNPEGQSFELLGDVRER